MSSRIRIGALLAILMICSLFPGSLSAQTDGETTHFDGMDGLTPALLSEESPDESRFTFLYSDGFYSITAHDTQYSGDLYSYLNLGQLADTRVSVDVAIENDQPGKAAFVGCRAGENTEGYAFEVQPATGDAIIWMLGDGTADILAQGNFASLIAPGFAFNTIEIECVQDSIAGSINGQVVLAEVDSTFSSGFSYIGGGVRASNPSDITVLFDNLTLTDLGASTQLAVETPSAGAGATSTQPGLEGALTYAEQNAPLAGPIQASTDVFDGDIKVLDAGVELSEFYAELGFTTPTDAPAGLWTAGFCFWKDASGDCLELAVGSNGASQQWFLGENTSGGGYDLIDSQSLTGLDLTPGAENLLGLYVEGQTAVLTVNSDLPAATISLPRTGSGDVSAILTFLADVEIEPGAVFMRTFGFAVWDVSGLALAPAEPTSVPVLAAPTQETGTGLVRGPLQPTAVPTTEASAGPGQGAGPYAGVLIERSESITTAPAGVSLADFTVSAVFVVPSDSTVPFDFGIGFRHTDANSQFRLMIQSTGAWAFAFGSDDPLQTGTLTSVQTAPGAENTLTIDVQGVSGTASMNGLPFATLDLSSWTAAGDIWVASGFGGDTSIPGRITPYHDFVVQPR